MDNFVFAAELFVITKGPSRRPIIQKVSDGQVTIDCIPFFTEQLLAERWMDAQKLSDPDLVMYKMTVQDSIKILEQYPADTDYRVAMDVERNNTKAAWIWTVGEAIERLAAN